MKLSKHSYFWLGLTALSVLFTGLSPLSASANGFPAGYYPHATVTASVSDPQYYWTGCRDNGQYKQCELYITFTSPSSFPLTAIGFYQSLNTSAYFNNSLDRNLLYDTTSNTVLIGNDCNCWDGGINSGYIYTVMVSGANLTAGHSYYMNMAMFYDPTMGTDPVPYGSLSMTLFSNVSPATVSLNYPTNGSTTPDFANWVVSTANAFAGNLSVVYGFSTTTMNNSDTITYSPFVNTNPVAISKHVALFYPPLAIPVHYYAQAILTGTSTVLYSPITSFYVDPNAPAPPASTSTNLAAPYSTISGGETSSTIAVPATNCNATSSSFWGQAVIDVQNGVCLAFTYLFIPNTPQQGDIDTRFNTLSGHISSKPPLGYFTLMSNDLNSLAVGTSSVVLLNATATAAFAPIISPIYTGATWLLWFLFALWLFNRIRHFNFQS